MRGGSKGDSCILGDDGGNLANAEGNRGVVIALAGGWDHGASYIANLGIIEDALEPVAHLDAASPGCHDQNHQHAAIVLVTDTPLIFKFGCELFDRLVVVERFDGNDCDLRVGLTVDLSTKRFEILLGRWRKHTGEVVDVAGRRWQRFDRLAYKQGRRRQ